MTFTEKLDMLMEVNHLNKNSLSKACGIPYTTIDGWYKKGVSDLKLSTLKKLTSFFGLSLDYWLDDDIEEIKKAPASEEAEADGYEVILSSLTGMLQRMGWVREDGDITLEDKRFLLAVAAMLNAYFEEHR